MSKIELYNFKTKESRFLTLEEFQEEVNTVGIDLTDILIEFIS